MKKLIVPLALVAMAALLCAAMAIDCVRLANAARHRVELADAEMQKYETRLANILAAAPKKTSETDTAVLAFQNAADLKSRHDAYERLVAVARAVQAEKTDPTNPADRKFMDDIAGAINRRAIARKQYDDELEAYQEFSASLRGKIAQFFSPSILL
jgi:hypothetical protein